MKLERKWYKALPRRLLLESELPDNSDIIKMPFRLRKSPLIIGEARVAIKQSAGSKVDAEIGYGQLKRGRNPALERKIRKMAAQQWPRLMARKGIKP